MFDMKFKAESVIMFTLFLYVRELSESFKNSITTIFIVAFICVEV